MHIEKGGIVMEEICVFDYLPLFCFVLVTVGLGGAKPVRTLGADYQRFCTVHGLIGLPRSLGSPWSPDTMCVANAAKQSPQFFGLGGKRNFTRLASTFS